MKVINVNLKTKTLIAKRHVGGGNLNQIAIPTPSHGASHTHIYCYMDYVVLANILRHIESPCDSSQYSYNVN